MHTPFCDCSAVALVNTIYRITHDNYGKTKICRIADQPRLLCESLVEGGHRECYSSLEDPPLGPWLGEG